MGIRRTDGTLLHGLYLNLGWYLPLTLEILAFQPAKLG